MYREHVLATRPYSYFTLDGSTGNVDTLGRSTSLTGVTATNLGAVPPRWYQPLVPGYTASELSSASTTPTKPFGKVGYESKAFSIDFWFDLHTVINTSSYTVSTTLFSQGGQNLVIADPKNLYVQFTASDPTKTIVLQYQIEDSWSAKHICISWGGTIAALFVNGELVDAVPVPTGFVFANSTSAMVFTAPAAGHIAIYDRLQTQNELIDKYNSISDLTSHSNSVERDGGELFEMWLTPEKYTDIPLTYDLAGSGSIGANINTDGLYSPVVVNKAVLSGGSLTQDGAGTTISSQYIFIDAYNYLSSSSWVISIETNDDNTRAGNEYLFTIYNPREALEFYVTSGNVLTVKKINFNADGTTTSTTYAYDTVVTTTARKFVFVMDNNYLYAKTGASSTVLNTISAVDNTYIPMSVMSGTKILIGTSADLTGVAVPKILNFYTHRAKLSATITGGSYDFYQNQYYSSGYWPLTSSYGLRGQSAQSLVSAPYVSTSSTIQSAFLKSEKTYGTDITFTSSVGNFTTREQVASVPTATIPFGSVAGAGFARQITSMIVDQQTANNRVDTQAPGIKSSTLRLFHTLRSNSTNSASYVAFTGAGACWMNNGPSTTMNHDRYAGVFFQSGSVGGPVVNPLVDGSTIRYTYRSFEFLVYCQSAATNTGHIVSFYDGTTEYYFRISGNSWQTNFSNVKINGQAIAGQSAQYLLDNWVHVYVEIPSTIQDRQVYVGKSYNGATYVNGVGVKNFATYDRVLTAAEIDEHYQCFTGRYSKSLAVVDTISLAENAVVSMYSVAWFSNIVPGSS
jgi:hypothetical protein